METKKIMDNISVGDEDGRIIVEFAGDITLQVIRTVKDEIFTLSSEHSKDIIFDLGQVSYIDSTGIGMLLTIHKMQQKNSRELVLRNVPEQIVRVLELSSLNMIL